MVLAALPAAGKTVVVTPFPFQTVHKTAQLNYPPFPAELLERIQGKHKTLSRPTQASVIQRDWALPSIGFFDTYSTLAPSATRSRAEACTSEVVVAVVDTGIDYTHPELRDHIWINPGETGAWEPPSELRAQGIACRDKSCNGIDDDGNGFVDDVAGWDFVHDVPLAYDTHGHGTHISGIIATSAAGPNGILEGSCPKVSIMPLKYYDSSGAGYNNLANTVRAIRYAVKNGANIINYSGGGSDPATAERAAIEDAERHGILFVAAAGNDGHDNDQIPYYPASYGLDNIVGVASLNKANVLLPSSNWGKKVQLAAPGLNILSTLPEGKFGTMSGTSQATAFVTGAAALLMAQAEASASLHTGSQTHATVDFHRVKRWLVEGARPMRGNERKTVLAAGLLSLPRSVAIEHADLRKNAPVLVSGPSETAPEVAFRPNVREKAR